MEKEKFYLIVAGNRTFTNGKLLTKKIDYFLKNKSEKEIIIVEGEARGADTLAREYGLMRGFGIKKFPANWETYGNRAGYIRNEEMYKFVSQFKDRGAVLFWDGHSKGTANDIELGKKYNIKTKIVYF